MLDSHQPYNRINNGEATATDRQWLRLLHEVFADLDYFVFVKAGMNPQVATNLLGLVAMNCREEEAK